MAETLIKGLSFIHMCEFLRKQGGEAGLARVMQALPPELAQSLERAYGHEWYPLRHMVDIERVVVDQLFGGDPEQAWRFGHFDGMRQIGVVYKVLLRVMSPDFLLKQSNKLWRSYMNAGGMEVESTGPRSCIARVAGYDPLHLVHCFENVGTFKAGFEVCGAKDAKIVHKDCRLSGAPACVYEASW